MRKTRVSACRNFENAFLKMGAKTAPKGWTYEIF